MKYIHNINVLQEPENELTKKSGWRGGKTNVCIAKRVAVLQTKEDKCFRVP